MVNSVPTRLLQFELKLADFTWGEDLTLSSYFFRLDVMFCVGRKGRKPSQVPAFAVEGTHNLNL